MRIDRFIEGLNCKIKPCVDTVEPQERNLGLIQPVGLGYLDLAKATFMMGVAPTPSKKPNPKHKKGQ